MKILSIHIKNINSLRGEFTIDFSNGALHHAGIFAITGATGAGKTTVLDAITLSLYGRVARNKDVKEVLSNGTVDCYANVVFQVFEKKYLASWQIHRARGKADGKISAPKRELALWDDTTDSFRVIAEKIKEVDAAVEKVSGLDYHRFTRSVLLSQGDFAAFLRADERERSDLLERITGTEIYSQLSIAAFEKFKEEKQLLANLQAQLEQLGVFSEEAIDKKQLAKAKKEAKKAETELEGYRDRLKILDRWKEASEKLKVLEKQQQQNIKETETFESEANQLKKSKALSPYHLDIEKVIQWKSQIEDLLLTETSLQQKLSKCRLKEVDLKNHLDNEIVKEAAFQKEKGEKEEIYQQVDRFNEKLLSLEVQLNDAKTKEQKTNQSLKENATAKANLKKKLQSLEENIENNQKYLTKHKQNADLLVVLPEIEGLRKQLLEVYQKREEFKKIVSASENLLEEKQEIESKAKEELEKAQKSLIVLETAYETMFPKDLTKEKGKSTTSIATAIQDIQEKINTIQQLSLLDEDYKNALKEQQEYEDHLADLTVKHENTTKSILSLIDQLHQFEEELVYKKAIYQQQQLLANYQKDRENLKPGDPCPLCLSTHHPFHDHPVEVFVDKAKIEFEKAEITVLKLKQSERLLFQKDSELRQEIDLLQGNEIKNNNGRLKQQLSKLQAYEGKMAELLQIQKSERSGELLKEELTKLKEQLTEWQSVKEKLDDLLQEMLEPKENIQVLERKVLTISLEIKSDKAKIASLTDSVVVNEKRFEELGKELSAKIKNYGYQFSLETAKQTFQDLRQKATIFQETSEKNQQEEQQKSVTSLQLEHIEKEEKQRNQELLELQSVMSNHQQSIDELNNKIAGLMGAQSVEAARLNLKNRGIQLVENLEKYRTSHIETSKELVALQQRFNEKSEQLKELQIADGKLRKTLSTDLKVLGYAEINLAIKDRLDPSREQQLEQKQLSLNNRTIEIERALKDTQKDLKKWVLSEKEKEEELDLRDKFEKQTSIYQESLHFFGQLEEKYKQQQKREEQHGLLLSKIENQRTVFNRWAQLNDLIGQADGKKFRTYAQGLTLQKLVSIANQYLEKLNGRYFIHKREHADLELEIIDTYQADNRRSMYTLSGGESFLISLSLAMGLSELAGKNAQIQSLFIDEGFGTLDAQSLDLALSTLENLQSEGKTIGVISHLKELKERIGVQIQVHKQSNGFSTLSVQG